MSKNFDGVDDVITVPAAAPNQDATYTVASWIYPESTTANKFDTIFARLWNSASGYGNTYYNAGGVHEQIEHWQNGALQLVSPVGSLPPNQWAFWAVTHDGTNGRLYTGRRNRVLTLDDTTAYGSQTFENATHQIGREGATSNPFDGIISHLSIWSEPLEIDHLHALMARPYAPLHRFSVGGTAAILRAYYPLWESTASVARDHSGNGNDGTVTGTLLDMEPPAHFFGRVMIPIGVAAAVAAVYSGRGVGRGLHRGVFR